MGGRGIRGGRGFRAFRAIQGFRAFRAIRPIRSFSKAKIHLFCLTSKQIKNMLSTSDFFAKKFGMATQMMYLCENYPNEKIMRVTGINGLVKMKT